MANAYSLSAGPHTATLKSLGAISMAGTRATPFDPKTFLSQAGDARTTLQCQKHKQAAEKRSTGSSLTDSLTSVIAEVSMRGATDRSLGLFTYVRPEDRIAGDQPPIPMPGCSARPMGRSAGSPISAMR